MVLQTPDSVCMMHLCGLDPNLLQWWLYNNRGVAIHSLEHLMATWFRNSEEKDDVVYVGPMGCLTGMYIIMTGTYTVEDMRRLTIECLQWILTQTEVPATRPEACGNYLLHDLPMCKWESARYLDRLQHDFHSEYTKLQVTLDDGKVFADA